MHRVLASLLVILFSLPLSAAGATYTYDAAGRLTRVEYAGGRGFSYQYDNAGNLLKRTALEPGARRRAVRRASSKPPGAPVAATSTINATRPSGR